MQPVIGLTLDCSDASLLASFWKVALGYVDEPAPAPFKSRSEWLASCGVPEEEWDQGAWLCDPEGIRPRLSILAVPEGKERKNRLHLDLHISIDGTEDDRWERLLAHVDGLVEAGGQVLQRYPKNHVVMADLEGNEFCVALIRPDDGRA